MDRLLVYILLIALSFSSVFAEETLSKSDKAQIDEFYKQLCTMMATIKKAAAEYKGDEPDVKDGLPLSMISSNEAVAINEQISELGEKSPVNLARALEKFMLTNRDFLAGTCADAFRYPYIFTVFRDWPEVNGHRFAELLANPKMSDADAAELMKTAIVHVNAFNIYAFIPEKVLLQRIQRCLTLDDLKQAEEFFGFVSIDGKDPDDADAEKLVKTPIRHCDKAYSFLYYRYRDGDLKDSGFKEPDYLEEHLAMAARAPLIAAARDFVAKKLARLDAVDALEKDLREQATLQLSPEEYDSVFKTWQTLGGGTAPDAELALTLDNLFAQAALNAKRAPSDRDKAMTMRLAQRARELLQKDKVEIAPFGESAIRSPESVWTWFRNSLAFRLYKQPDVLNETRDIALEKFLKVYEARHDKGELFRVPQEPAAPADKPEKPVRPAAKR